MYYPSNPYLGQLSVIDGHLWRYNGLTWDRVRIGKSPATQTTQGTSSDCDVTNADLVARIEVLEQALENGFLLLE